MNKKMLVFIIFVLVSLLFGCEKKVTINFPNASFDSKEAYSILTNTLTEKMNKDNIYFKKMLASDDSLHVAFVWKIKGKKSMYIRYWSYDGSNLRVLLEESEKRHLYYVTLKNDGEDSGDCYGYSDSMPVPKAKRFDIYWDNTVPNGCRQSIKYEFSNKENAIKFAQVLKYIFIDHKVYDLLFELDDSDKIPVSSVNNDLRENLEQKTNEEMSTEKKSEKEKTINVDDSLNNHIKDKPYCSVDKILKMKKIGLTDFEIKSICK